MLDLIKTRAFWLYMYLEIVLAINVIIIPLSFFISLSLMWFVILLNMVVAIFEIIKLLFLDLTEPQDLILEWSKNVLYEDSKYIVAKGQLPGESEEVPLGVMYGLEGGRIVYGIKIDKIPKWARIILLRNFESDKYLVFIPRFVPMWLKEKAIIEEL